MFADSQEFEKFQDFVAKIAKTRSSEHLVKLWQAADNEDVEQGRLMYQLALQGKARLIWARAEMTTHCPKCGSTSTSMPDDEGLIDCLKCGTWFDMTHPNQTGCTPMGYAPIKTEYSHIEIGPGSKFKIV